MGQLPASFQRLKTDAGQCGQNWILVLMAPRGAFCPPSTLLFLVRGDKFPFFNWSSLRLSEAFRFFSSLPASVLKVGRMVELVGMLLKVVNTQSQHTRSTRCLSSRKSGAQTLKADVVDFLSRSCRVRCRRRPCSLAAFSPPALRFSPISRVIAASRLQLIPNSSSLRIRRWETEGRVFEQGASFIALLSSLGFVLAHILGQPNFAPRSLNRREASLADEGLLLFFISLFFFALAEVDHSDTEVMKSAESAGRVQEGAHVAVTSDLSRSNVFMYKAVNLIKYSIL